MKSDDLFNAIAHADDEMIKNAKNPIIKKRNIKKTAWISALAALLSISLIMGLFLFPFSPGAMNSFAIAEVKYPTSVPYSSDDDGYEARKAWRQNKNALKEDYNALSPNMSEFLYSTISELVKAREGKNTVYSPINIYMAFAMLAEITDGESRQQILDVLGSDTIDQLRKEASAIWKSSYSDDGAITSILASSIWLNDSIGYNADTMKTLADIYYASSFQGTMGDEKYTAQLRKWLNDNTGNLLTESAKKIELDPRTVIALATTVYFNARWSDTFAESQTKKSTFHTTNGNIECEFMNGIQTGTFYTADKFTAIRSGFETGSEKAGMWLILPNEGESVETVASDSQMLELILAKSKGESWENEQYSIIDLSLPKFDVTSDLDLVESMMNLGITDVFDPSVSDFTPMTDEIDGVFVSSVQHSARVMVDEEGCTAAAFTVITTEGTGAPLYEVNFTLDRPFLFVITSDVGLPLFIGTVNQPN